MKRWMHIRKTKTITDEGGNENMRKERLMASCEEYIETWRGRVKKTGGAGSKMVMIGWRRRWKSRDAHLSFFLSIFFPLISPSSLLASWQLSGSQTTICLLEKSKRPSISCLLPSPFSTLALLHFSSSSCGRETLPLTVCEWKSRRRSQLTHRVLIR